MKLYHNKIEEIRKEKKIRSDAIFTQLGISRSTLWLWEKGKVTPSENSIRKLAKILGVSVNVISNLKPTKHIFDLSQSSNINNLFNSFSSNNLYERKKKQKFHFESLEKQFDEFNHITSLLETFIHSLQLIFYVKDTHCKYILVNNAFLRNVLVNSDFNIYGLKDQNFFPPKEAKLNNEEDMEVIRSGNEIYREGFIPGSKNKKWGIISKLPVYDSQKNIIGILAYFTDLTKQKEQAKMNNIINYAISNSHSILWIAKGLNRSSSLPFYNKLIFNSINISKSNIIKEYWGEINPSELSNQEIASIWSDSIIHKAKHFKFKKVLKFPTSRTYNVLSPYTKKILKISENIYFNKQKEHFIGFISFCQEVINSNSFNRIINILNKYGVNEKIKKEIAEELTF